MSAISDVRLFTNQNHQYDTRLSFELVGNQSPIKKDRNTPKKYEICKLTFFQSIKIQCFNPFI